MRRRKKDPRDEYYDKKVDELEFNENIDDEYTKNVMNKCLRGHQDNKWMAASGILSILLGAACIITMIIVGLVFVYSSESLHDMAVIDGTVDFEAEKRKVIICSIIIPLIGILNIYLGLKINSFAGYTREMLMRNTGTIVCFGIMQCIAGGFFICILTFIGYLVGRGMDYGAIYYNKVDTYSNKEWELEERYLNKELKAIKDSIFEDDKNVEDDEIIIKSKKKKRKKA